MTDNYGSRRREGIRLDWTSIPKVELHLHLDGSVRPETLWQLLQETRRDSAQGDSVFQSLNSLLDVKNWIEVGDDCRSLAEYLARFELPLAVMQQRTALERIAYELVSDVAKENVRYVEVRFAPMLHTRRGLTMTDAARAVLAGLRRGERAFGVGTGLIACCMRHADPADNVEMVRQMEPLAGQGLVAIDLAGDEAAFPAELHFDAFALAREIGFPITVHAGEARGVAEMRYAIETLGAKRIGHGVRLEDDPELMQMVIDKGIVLDMCPISNVQTKAVNSLREHPLQRYHRAGVRVTVSTDNRTVSATTLAREYEGIATELGCTAEEVQQMIIHAAEAAFLPEKEKRRLVAELQGG